MDISMFWWIIFCLSILLTLTLVAAFHFYIRLKRELFRTRSLSSKYGKLTEQFLPLVDSFPWNPNNFRFLGSPIDGVQFEDDRIILVEFKTATSRLSLRQRQIRDLVKDGKVKFEIIRMD